MADEIKNEINEEKKECRCRKELKLFLLMILGSFLGCLVALTLFTAAIKPNVPPAPQPQMQPPCQRIEGIRQRPDMGAPRGGEFRQDKIREHKGGERPDQKPPVKPEQKA
jgi:hypothetical protein